MIKYNFFTPLKTKIMKKNILILILALASMSLKTFSQSSSFTVFSEDGQKFWLIVNGIRQNAEPKTNIKVTDLTAPNYRAKIIFEEEGIADIDKTIYTKDVDENYFDVAYVVRRHKTKKEYVMRISSFSESASASANQFSIPVSTQETTSGTQQKPSPQKPPETTTTQTTITTTTTENVKPGSEGISTGISITDPGTGEQVDVNINLKVPTESSMEFGMDVHDSGTQTGVSTTTTTTTTYTETTQISKPPVTEDKPPAIKEPNHYIMPGYSGKIGCPWPMSNEEFESAKRSIGSQSFKDDKLTIAKQIASANCLVCSQIKDIIGLFSFEDSRLDFAKFAYDHVYDISNYFKINDAFSFSSSVSELNSYIQRKQR